MNSTGQPSDQFAIELDRDILHAAHAQAARLEIFHFARGDIGSENDVLQIFQQLEIADLLEDEDVEQAIVDHRVLEKRKRPAVKPAVADEDERAFFRLRFLRFDQEPRRPPARDLRGGDEITQRPEISFESEAGFLHHLRVEADAGELHEMFAVRASADRPAGCAPRG